MSIFIDREHTWRYDSPSQTTAPNYVYAAIGDVVRCAFDFTLPMPSDTAISSISSVTIADIEGATEPTLGSPAISYDRKKAELDITCTSATASTYTLTATVVTTDSQTLKRKGKLVVS